MRQKGQQKRNEAQTLLISSDSRKCCMFVSNIDEDFRIVPVADPEAKVLPTTVTSYETLLLSKNSLRPRIVSMPSDRNTADGDLINNLPVGWYLFKLFLSDRLIFSRTEGHLDIFNCFDQWRQKVTGRRATTDEGTDGDADEFKEELGYR